MPHLETQPVPIERPAFEIRNAFYIKLGKGGVWESDSLARNIMRIGWPHNSLEDINSGNWESIQKQLQQDLANRGVASRALGGLRKIVTSNEEDVWITFHGSRLWWCRLAADPVEKDEISKFRRVMGSWTDQSLDGRTLLTAVIPGTISQMQGFRWTVCSVHAKDSLRRLLNGEASPPHRAVTMARNALIEQVKAALAELHWKDFETLVDLLFRQAGWRRLSVLGETMKYADLELEEPITGERYQVQIKSSADTPDLVKYRDQFEGRGFRKLFFVVHSPTPRLAKESSEASVELLLPTRLASMVVDAGLVSWILAKIH